MTQPISGFRKRFRDGRAKSQKEMEDRAFRENQDHYNTQGYEPKVAEEKAQSDFDIAQRLKKRRGLKGITLGNSDWY